jgi:hypothetical protein
VNLVSDSHDAPADANREELLEVIEEQGERLGLYASVLLGLGFDPADLMGAVA